MKSNANRPNTGLIEKSGRPSAPPVSQRARFAASNSRKPMPSVTSRRVRSLPRTTIGVSTKATVALTRIAASRAEQRIGQSMARQDRRGVGAEAEERRVPERDDAAVSLQQVVGEREHRQHEDLRDQAEIARKREVARDRRGQQERRKAELAQRRHAARLASPFGIERQDRDQEDVDHEGADRRHEVLEQRVDDAERDGRDERTADRSRPADRDDHQHDDEILERECRIEAEEIDRQCATQALPSRRRARTSRRTGGRP